jgi:hypothetical protein
MKAKLSLFLTNYALYYEGVWGNGCTDPRVCDLGTGWRWVISLTPRSLYPPVKSLRYPLETGWAPGPVLRIWKSENPWSYRDSNSDHSVVKTVDRGYTDYATTPLLIKKHGVGIFLLPPII